MTRRDVALSDAAQGGVGGGHVDGLQADVVDAGAVEGQVAVQLQLTPRAGDPPGEGQAAGSGFAVLVEVVEIGAAGDQCAVIVGLPISRVPTPSKSLG